MAEQIKTQIGKLGRIVTGKTPPTKVLEYFGDRYPFITPSDISDYSIKYLATTERGLSEAGKNYQKSLLIPKDTVCFVAIGSTVGKMCFTKTKGFTNQQIHSIIVDENKNNPHYVFYKIHFEYPKIKSIADANGAGKPIINKTDFSNIDTEVPDLPTQHKIASILSAYDDLIENNTRRIKILEEMAQTIYKEWFVNFRFPGYEKVKFVESSLGKIPEGWKIKKLEKFCFKLTDGTHDTPKPKDEGYPLITGKQMKNGFINFDECYNISEEDHVEVMKRSKPEVGDIIYSNIGTLGSCHYVLENFEFSIKNVALFKPQNKLYSVYLFLYLSSPITLEILSQKASGTSQKFFSLVFLRNIDCVDPESKILGQLYEIIYPILRERHLINLKNQNLRKTRDLLLPKLMSGEVEA